jgi:dnd system-associated protein 4
MRGIRISEQFKDLVEKLAQTHHREAGKSIFATMRELVCFAAVLGFENERKHPLQSKTFEVDGRIYSNSQQALDLLYLICLAHSRDAEVLREENEDASIEVFEEYAQGGFEILEGWLREKPEDLNGDQAILTALAKHKFLDAPKNVVTATGEVAF